MSLVVMLVACGDVMMSEPADPDSPAPDVPEPMPARCDPSTPFGPPVAVAELNTDGPDYTARLSPDELTLYLAREDLYVSTRTTRDDAWDPPRLLDSVNTTGIEYGATVTADGLTMYFASNRNDVNALDLYYARRPSLDAEFVTPQRLSISSGGDFDPFISADGETLYWWVMSSDAGWDIYSATLNGPGFTPPALVAGLQSPGDDSHIVVSRDQLTAFFGSTREGGDGGLDIYVATRASTSVAFEQITRLPQLASEVDDLPAWVSDDGCVLYMFSNRAGSHDVYVATRG